MIDGPARPQPPETYPRRILLMVIGRTPQVMTETLFALAQQRQPPFIPTEIHLITTKDGEKDARLALLSDDPGWFHRLRKDYGLPPILFDADTIHLIRGADGEPLDDVRTAEDNEACANLITDLVRTLTADDQSALHVSLAGGRKTMTYYLGNALALFGRPQDRLSHTLVDTPYETHRDFYYPTPHGHTIFVEREGRYFDCRDAQVTLADIPLVQLRGALPARYKTLDSGKDSFSDVVAAASRQLRPVSVLIDYVDRVLVTDNQQHVHLAPAELAFYGWMARRRKAGLPPIAIPTDGAADIDYATAFQKEYRLAGADPQAVTNMQDEGGMTKAYFSQRKTRIRDALNEELGVRASAYDIQGEKIGRLKQWGLSIEPDKIDFREE